MESFSYNVRVKIFPDGTKQYQWSERTLIRGSKREKKKLTGQTIKQKEIENNKRAIQKVYDYARSNDFDWFVTLTFDGSKVDRYDYEDVANALKTWTKDLCIVGECSWLIVPEQHEDGAYHFHGLIKGYLPVTPAINPYTQKLLIDKSGNQIYNIDSYTIGYTTATKIKDRKRTASYLAKYLTKEITVPKGRKRYWASRDLNIPIEHYTVMSTYEFGALLESSRYSKVIRSPYGDFVLAEE